MKIKYLFSIPFFHYIFLLFIHFPFYFINILKIFANQHFFFDLGNNSINKKYNKLDNKIKEEKIAQKSPCLRYEDKYIKEWKKLNESVNKESLPELSQMKFNFLLENTPLGNVIIYFNNEKETFEFYSDFTIPYRYLETIGRRYSIIYKCPGIYIDMKEEIENAYKKKKEKEEEKEGKEKEKEEEKDKEKDKKDEKDEKEGNEEKEKKGKDEKKKNVFANFKNYHSTGNVTNPTLQKGRNNSSYDIPDPLKKQFKTSISEKNIHVLKERSNHYIYKGKLSNFNFLQNSTNNSKSSDISYKDFMKKKMEECKKE